MRNTFIGTISDGQCHASILPSVLEFLQFSDHVAGRRVTRCSRKASNSLYQECPKIIRRCLERFSFVSERSRARNPSPFLPDNDINLERSGPANVLCHRSPMSRQYLRFLERSEELFTPLTSRVPRRKKLARPMAGVGWNGETRLVK